MYRLPQEEQRVKFIGSTVNVGLSEVSSNASTCSLTAIFLPGSCLSLSVSEALDSSLSFTQEVVKVRRGKVPHFTGGG